MIRAGNVGEIVAMALRARAASEAGRWCECSEPITHGLDLLCGTCLLNSRRQWIDRTLHLSLAHEFEAATEGAAALLGWCERCAYEEARPWHHGTHREPNFGDGFNITAAEAEYVAERMAADAMKVVGLDLSMSATGIAHATGERTLTFRSGLSREQRLVMIRDQVLELLEPTTVFVIEDLPENVKYGGVPGGMVHGVVRVALLEHDAPYVLVPPSSLKAYTTGKGGASKDEMLVEAVRRLGFAGHDHNQADALWLRAMGHDALGDPLAHMPAAHRAHLDKIDWTPIGVPA
ncbi:MAG: hypothetical protein QM757_14755 [Paludibaculum sp.]